MKRKIIMLISAMLTVFFVASPDEQPAIEAIKLVTIDAPVMTQSALVQLTIEAEPATESSLKDVGGGVLDVPEEIPPEKIYDNEWAFYLIDRQNPLPDDFEIALYSLGEEDEWWREIDERLAEYALQMLEAARLDGIHIVIIEGFRTIERQQEIYDRRINYYLGLGLNLAQSELVAGTEVAYPGASEHNAGIAIDFASGSYDVYSFENTREFAWLAENAHDYGFILRYPEDAMHITGFIYEPWHWRFVGVERARELAESGLTLEEFLMQLYAE
ncbi:MAG: M15 family metallopeptidase [Oscillospiraceae bacterium]|nr:M15 family metallopeptidase [Oscillospiraceae bacterium]